MMQAGLSGSSELHLCECDIEGFVLQRSTPQSQCTIVSNSALGQWSPVKYIYHLSLFFLLGLKDASIIYSPWQRMV